MRYGITLEIYQKILAAQGGGCAICGSNRRLHTDHSHSTKVVRGILCENCNRGLGMFQDSSDRLRLAMAYLDASR